MKREMMPELWLTGLNLNDKCYNIMTHYGVTLKQHKFDQDNIFYLSLTFVNEKWSFIMQLYLN